MSMYEIRRC